MSFLLAFFLLLPHLAGTALHAATVSSWFAADGPTRATILLSDSEHVQVMMSYDGFLYECPPPSYNGTRVTAVFVFRNATDERIIERRMTPWCTTPWSYMLPTEAAMGLHQGYDSNEDELWSAFREFIIEEGGVLELAFRDDDGQWDSRYGQNYRLYFSRTDHSD
ncbi:MAG: hypothetical protein HRU19_32095 [Pseudobacteriovorax sp.]|nr:hypothetical protein [Pseudobacteriovorax sp.]